MQLFYFERKLIVKQELPWLTSAKRGKGNELHRTGV